MEWQSAHVMPTLVELPRVVDLAPDSDDCVQPQQLDGHGGVVQIDLSGAQRGDELARQGLHVDLEADRQRGRRRNRGDDFVHPQHVGPQLFVAEGVVAEDGLPVPLMSVAIVPGATGGLIRWCTRRDLGDGQRQRQNEHRLQQH